MHLGKDSAYAVFALVELAARGIGTPVTLADLAESTGIAAEALSLTLAKLAGANVVTRECGLPECFALKKPAERIALLDVVEAIEGPAPPDLLVPKRTGSVNASVPDDTPQSGSSLDETGPPVWKDKLDVTTVPTLAAELLSASTIQDLVDAQRTPANDSND